MTEDQEREACKAHHPASRGAVDRAFFEIVQQLESQEDPA